MRVTRGGERVTLEPRAFDLLVYLAERPGQLVAKETLVRDVWHGTAVSDNAITRVVAQLRRALGDTAHEPRFIETVPTRGYRFIADVVRESVPTDEPAAPSAVASPTFTGRGRVLTAPRIAALAGAARRRDDGGLDDRAGHLAASGPAGFRSDVLGGGPETTHGLVGPGSVSRGVARRNSRRLRLRLLWPLRDRDPRAQPRWGRAVPHDRRAAERSAGLVARRPVHRVPFPHVGWRLARLVAGGRAAAGGRRGQRAGVVPGRCVAGVSVRGAHRPGAKRRRGDAAVHDPDRVRLGRRVAPVDPARGTGRRPRPPVLVT